MTTVQQPDDSSQQPAQPCTHWVGAESRPCGQTDGVRRYQQGHRCPGHTPARLAGHPEAPETGPAWWVRLDGSSIPAAPLSTSHVHDRRAVDSGRRVSGERRRAARQGETYETENAGTRRDAA